jgi:integrase
MWMGVDPAAMEAERKAKERITFKAVASQYLRRQESNLRPNTMRDAKRYLLTSFKQLHALPIHEITRKHIAPILADIAEEAPAAAINARGALSALFSWAKGEGLLDGDNPVEGTNVPATIKSRDRVLTDSELAAIWNACEGPFGDIVRLLILTACRRQEVGGMRRSELDADSGTWTIPSERTKNGEQHVLPLPSLAWRIIGDYESADPLFSNGVGGFSDWTRCKKRLDSRVAIPEWRLHDLRRTAATRLGDLKVLPHVIETILNHTSGHKAGVAGVYNRSAYTQQMKSALAVWAEHVAAITSGEERKLLQFPAS